MREVTKGPSWTSPVPGGWRDVPLLGYPWHTQPLTPFWKFGFTPSPVGGYRKNMWKIPNCGACTPGIHGTGIIVKKLGPRGYLAGPSAYIGSPIFWGVGGRELDFHTADSPEARLHRRHGLHFPVHLTGCSDPGYLKINSDPR